MDKTGNVLKLRYLDLADVDLEKITLPNLKRVVKRAIQVGGARSYVFFGKPHTDKWVEHTDGYMGGPSGSRGPHLDSAAGHCDYPEKEDDYGPDSDSDLGGDGE